MATVSFSSQPSVCQHFTGRKLNDPEAFISPAFFNRRHRSVKVQTLQSSDLNGDEKKSARVVAPKPEFKLPESVDGSVTQARLAIERAINDGNKRLSIELLLPLIGATDLDDWPGGIRQQLKAASPLISSLLAGLVIGPGSSVPFGGCSKTVIDDSDAIVLWEAKEKVALVLFPSAETLPTVESLARDASRPVILANTQWQGGQVISDFGFGSKRKAAEELLSSFLNVYTLKRLRVRSKDVRLLKCYPSDWQVFVGNEDGSAVFVCAEKEMPSYKQLEAILDKFSGRDGPSSWLDRLKEEFKFNRDSLSS